MLLWRMLLSMLLTLSNLEDSLLLNSWEIRLLFMIEDTEDRSGVV